MILFMGKNPAPVEGKVVYPIIYRVLAPSQVVFSPDFWTINSRWNLMWHLFNQTIQAIRWQAVKNSQLSDAGDYGPEVLLRELQVWTAKVFFATKPLRLPLKWWRKVREFPFKMPETFRFRNCSNLPSFVRLLLILLKHASGFFWAGDFFDESTW